MSEKLENNATTVAARCSIIKPIFQKSQNPKFAVQERVVRPQILGTNPTKTPLSDPKFRRPPQSGTKETVLPTAFVSPHTVQINVQPATPNLQASTPPPTPFLTSLVASYMTPAGHYLAQCQKRPGSYVDRRQDFRDDDYARPTWRRGFDVNNNEASSSNRVSWPAANLRQMTTMGDSDERLNKLEERMKMLESQLRPKEEGSSCKCCSKSMKDLSTSDYQTVEPLSQSSSYQNLTTVYEPTNRDKVHFMNEQIRDLQRILEEGQTSFGDGQTSHSLNNKNATIWPTNVVAPSSAYRPGMIKNSMSLDNILRENQSLHETVDDLKHKLEAVSTSSLAPDQYVTMQRYRLLKAKSKRLLHDKCEALRAALLERDSAQVKMQLQDKELSELRRQVYEHDCGCKDSNNDEQLHRLYSEMLQLCKVSAQTSSCLLDVCKDISNKRCPDYDQILGLKVNDDVLKRTLKTLGGSSNSLNCSNSLNIDQSALAEQLLALHKSTVQNLNQMQKLMVDYYTNELVDSIDCRLQ